MPYSTLFFDLDETLYPSSSGVWVLIRDRINAYMHDCLGFPMEGIEAVREKYFREYGTTLRGLQANYQVDMDEYLAFVHNVPLDGHLHPEAVLRRTLENIPARKFIFTNADCAHAGRVIKALDLEGIFDGCIDVHTIAPHCKPMPGSFQLALAAVGNPDPHTCALLDDQARITRAARALGFFTILVGKGTAGEDADAALDNWVDLPRILDGNH
jgi:putative hydrolase of the HAD superfamily